MYRYADGADVVASIYLTERWRCFCRSCNAEAIHKAQLIRMLRLDSPHEVIVAVSHSSNADFMLASAVAHVPVAM